MTALDTFVVDVSCGELAHSSTAQDKQQQQSLQCTAAMLHSVSMVDIRSHLGAVQSDRANSDSSDRISDSGGNIVVVKVS
jgi:hypothetical protein